MSDHDFIAGIPLVLGGNVFGWSSKGDEAFAVLDAFYEAGGRMIDTADVYSAWIPGHKGGESETVLGQWLENSGVRNEMRIHTKTDMLGGAELYEPARVLRSLDASLERLRTDRIDLYYAHKDYPELEIAQIVAAFDAQDVDTIGRSECRKRTVCAGKQCRNEPDDKYNRQGMRHMVQRNCREQVVFR